MSQKRAANIVRSILGMRSLANRVRIVQQLKKKLKKYDRIAMVGDDPHRKEKSLAYKNPEKANAEMSGYLWAVPTTPTPFVGEAPAPGRYGRHVINSQQFRHPVDIALPKPKSVYRIFFTGSSTAFSSGAPSDDTTISGYLQKLMDQRLTPQTNMRYEVVNAANPGWASTYERLWIEFKLIEMEPDMIIQFSGNNEAHWGARNYSTGWMRTYAEQLYWAMMSSWYLYFGKEQLQDVVPREDARISPERVARTLSRNIHACLRLLAELKVPYVFILHPTIAETAKALSAREQRMKENDETVTYFSTCYAAMRRMMEEIRACENSDLVRLLDYSGIFDDRGANEEIFLDPYHFGDRGNEIIAARIFKDLSPLITSATQSS